MKTNTKHALSTLALLLVIFGGYICGAWIDTQTGNACTANMPGRKK